MHKQVQEESAEERRRVLFHEFHSENYLAGRLSEVLLGTVFIWVMEYLSPKNVGFLFFDLSYQLRIILADELVL